MLYSILLKINLVLFPFLAYNKAAFRIFALECYIAKYIIVRGRLMSKQRGSKG